MDMRLVLEERVRELASIGDAAGLAVLLRQGVDVNSQNRMNGWTALHWAAKRNNAGIVDLLLKNGADASVCNGKGQTAAELATSAEVRASLGGRPADAEEKAAPEATGNVEFVPNYLRYPVFPYSPEVEQARTESPVVATNIPAPSFQMDAPAALFAPPLSVAPPADLPRSPQGTSTPGVLVLKLRIAGVGDGDFVEGEMLRSHGFRGLVRLACAELNVQPKRIQKLRKLPNTVVRDDRDVARFVQFQEIELVLNAGDE